MDGAIPRGTTGNLLLDATGGDQLERLLCRSVRREIGTGEQYVAPGDEVWFTFFPIRGTLSLLAAPEPGLEVEAGTIGREGAADIFVAIGKRRAAHELIGQVPGEMVVIAAEDVAQEASQPGRFQDLVHGYIQAMYSQAAYSAACNAVHPADQRTARWLLMTHDRVDEDTFELRQEFLAAMIGVQRPTVSLAAGALRQAGLIEYTRGRITILDRDGLEDVSCPCYEQTRLAYSLYVQL
jgi:CRP-like cAMP-binding protein